MIHLEPPYRVIDGHALLPDHADPTLFYVLPARPSLAVDADGHPAFSLVQYLGEAGSSIRAGGFLTLTTELFVSDETLTRLAEELQKPGPAGIDLPRGARPRLVPVPFDSGTVELIALGQSSTDDNATTSTGVITTGATRPENTGGSGSLSRIHFLGSGKPSLGGRNRATFQLLLEPFEAELVERSLESAAFPAVVVYRMLFTALRPSFHVNVRADWQRLYRFLENRANLNVVYVAADAASMVRDALQESDIDVETSIFGTGDEARQAAENARTQLIDWVLERFFEPVADPTASTTEGIAGALSSAVDDALWSFTRTLTPGAGYRLRHMDEVELRYLTANMNEAAAERREFTPQATLGGLFESLRLDSQGEVRSDWPARKERLVTRINIAGFPRLQVEVGVETQRFKQDGLSQVIVEVARSLTPAGDPIDGRTFVFRSESERHIYAINLLGAAPDERFQPYHYRIEVHFDPAGPFGARPPVRSEWLSARATQLIVEPRSVYTMREVEVRTSPLFSFSQFPAVTVELRKTEDGAPRQESRLVLTSERPEGLWRFPTRGADSEPYEYRLTYHRNAAAGGDIVTSWRSGTDSWLTIPDPLPVKRTVNIFPSLPWNQILYAFVQIRYRDDENGVHFDEQIDLSSSTPFIRRDYPIAAQGHRRISYRLTLLFTHGELLDGSWHETEDERLILDEGLVRRRVVRVQWIGTLEHHSLSEVRITLEVPDPGGGEPRAQTEIRVLPTNQHEAAPPFEYLLGDPPAEQLRYSALFIDRNGFTERTPWKETTGDLIVVHLGTKSLAG